LKALYEKQPEVLLIKTKIGRKYKGIATFLKKEECHNLCEN